MPKREERDESQGQQHGAGAGRAKEKEKASQGGRTSSAEDLKKREYRDKQGNIHHHTHTSEEETRRQRVMTGPAAGPSNMPETGEN